MGRPKKSQIVESTAQRLSVAKLAELDPAQMDFIRALLFGATITAAAAEVGISRRTATNWMVPGHKVCDAYFKTRSQMATQLCEGKQRLQYLAMRALEDALSPTTPIATRVQAAQFMYKEMSENPPKAWHNVPIPDGIPASHQFVSEFLPERYNTKNSTYVGLDNMEYLSDEEIFQLQQLVSSVPMVADGGVTLFVNTYRMLPRDKAEVTKEFEVLERENLKRMQAALGERMEPEYQKRLQELLKK
jgi:hypothetical protein